MTPLRQQMIDAMHQRGLSDRTHETYLGAVRNLAKYYHTPPDEIQLEQIQEYFVYLVQQRGVSGATCCLYLNALRFLYLQVLQWDHFDVPIHYPKRAQKIPELLTRQEVKQILEACVNHKHRMMLTICYGCGLRVSELVAIKIRHIDGERHLLRVEQGKGAKDRVVILSATLLDQLRHYWMRYRPVLWLFPSASRPGQHLTLATAQKAFKKAKTITGIEKIGGIHSLRHAYATHQLENGLPIHKLQRQLGHRNLQSTLRYLHWLPTYQQGQTVFSDLVGRLEVDHD
jgi:site-specific recombinase XerD